MTTYGKQLFTGAAFILMHMIAQNQSSMAQATVQNRSSMAPVPANKKPDENYKKTLISKVEEVVNGSKKRIQTISNYGCYWDMNFGSGKCAPIVGQTAACLKMKKDRAKYSLKEYQEILEEMDRFVRDKEKAMIREIAGSSTNSPKLQASINDKTKELGTGINNMITGFNINIAPLKEDYNTIYGTPNCPLK